jgi:two-component system, LuxR family, sensor kinase FixL
LRRITRTRIDLALRSSPALPRVIGDRIQLQQVIVNLLVNSLQAIEQGGPLRRIRLDTAAGADGMVGFSIRDSGPGIGAEDLDRVFDGFFTTKEGGLGIGLAICHSIITAHGGSMTAANDPAGGAHFQFILPAAPPIFLKPAIKPATEPANPSNSSD